MNELPELYISADSHVVEPKDLWLTRMDKRLRERAPRIQSRPDGDYFAIEGVEPFSISPLGAMIQDKVAGRTVTTRTGKRAEDIRAGAWQPGARLADQQLDHIRAEVLYPGYGLVIFGAPDPEYQLACFQCYNDWLSDFCVEMDGRALGAAVLPGNCPIEVMIREAQRIARKPGLRSVMLVNNPTGRPYSSPVYDPLWAAISDLDLPVAIHMGTSTGEQLKDRIERFGGVYGVHLVDNRMGNAMRLLAQLIFGAVTQRFPRLRFVMVESGIGWIAGVLHFLDHWWTENRLWMEPRTDEKPSFFFKRNFWRPSKTIAPASSRAICSTSTISCGARIIPTPRAPFRIRASRSAAISPTWTRTKCAEWYGTTPPPCTASISPQGWTNGVAWQ